MISYRENSLLLFHIICERDHQKVSALPNQVYFYFGFDSNSTNCSILSQSMTTNKNFVLLRSESNAMYSDFSNILSYFSSATYVYEYDRVPLQQIFVQSVLSAKGNHLNIWGSILTGLISPRNDRCHL